MARKVARYRKNVATFCEVSCHLLLINVRFQGNITSFEGNKTAFSAIIIPSYMKQTRWLFTLNKMDEIY